MAGDKSGPGGRQTGPTRLQREEELEKEMDATGGRRRYNNGIRLGGVAGRAQMGNVGGMENVT